MNYLKFRYLFFPSLLSLRIGLQRLGFSDYNSSHEKFVLGTRVSSKIEEEGIVPYNKDLSPLHESFIMESNPNIKTVGYYVWPIIGTSHLSYVSGAYYVEFEIGDIQLYQYGAKQDPKNFIAWVATFCFVAVFLALLVSLTSLKEYGGGIIAGMLGIYFMAFIYSWNHSELYNAIEEVSETEDENV